MHRAYSKQRLFRLISCHLIGALSLGCFVLSYFAIDEVYERSGLIALGTIFFMVSVGFLLAAFEQDEEIISDHKKKE